MKGNRQKAKEKEQIKDQLDSALANLTGQTEEIPQEELVAGPDKASVTVQDEEHLKIENTEYLLCRNHKDAFQPDKLAERYNSILSKYDYIVGDWGYDQLRLAGFYRDTHSKAPFEKKIGFLEDYLYEYCNFGCAYFVLEKQRDGREKPTKSKRRRKSRREQDTVQEGALPEKRTVNNAEQGEAKPASKPRKRRDDRRKQDGVTQLTQFKMKEGQGGAPSGQLDRAPSVKKSPRPKKSFRIRETD